MTKSEKEYHTSKVIEALRRDNFESIVKNENYLYAQKGGDSFVFSVVRKNYTNENESKMTVIKNAHLDGLIKTATAHQKIPICVFSLWLKSKETLHVLTIPVDHIDDDFKKVKNGYSIKFSDLVDGSKHQYSRCQSFVVESEQSYHSWQLYSDDVAIKKADKSVFLHHGTAIPKEMLHFFRIAEMSEGDRLPVSLVHSSGVYSADFTVTNNRTRLFWKSDLSKLIQTTFPNAHQYYINSQQVPAIESPLIRFQRESTDDQYSYLIEFIDPSAIEDDVKAEIDEENEPKGDGTIKDFYGKRYERNPENRKKAIEIHGTTCSVCGFNFNVINLKDRFVI